MNDRQMITVIIVLAILYFWNRKKDVVSTVIDSGGVPIPRKTETEQGVATGGEVPPKSHSDSQGVSDLPPLVQDEPNIASSTRESTKFPKIGENIDTAGLRFNDMVFSDGTPRILTWAQLAQMDDGARIPYTHLNREELAYNWRKQPDNIAWTAY
jgi:hypothetical protein